MKKKTANKKAWSGRFSKGADKLAEEFNSSVGFDLRLFSHDIRGSVAHARVLKKAGVLTAKEAARIVKGLKSIEREFASGKLAIGADTEDVHMAVEARLMEKIGAVGGKLHTGRSRNDQVALDLRLYLKEELVLIAGLIKKLRATLVTLAKKNLGVVMPGYTHMQRAQPVLLAHHLLAYYEMFSRDGERLADTLKRVDTMPLGSGALAGSPFKLDRRYAAGLLGFSKVTQNSLDAVGDRDFIIEYLSFAAILMMHMSRLAEELVLWSSEEFGFVEIAEEFSTGSSIMPQKKNPDVAELVRGKTGRVYGGLFTLLTVMKALPLAYNKDMQEDKEPLFDAVDTVKACLGVMVPMLKTMKVNKARLAGAVTGGFGTATDAADYLVAKGMPFRRSHFVVGRVVRYCMEEGKGLGDLTLKQWKGFSKLFEKDIMRAVSIASSVEARGVEGGTSPRLVAKRLKQIERELKKSQ
jgi:argininosuccinate lyase